MWTSDVPVVFLFFNRPGHARRVFEQIRAARPRRVVLVSDGPRAHIPGEDALVAQLRRDIEAMIDWPAEVDTDYAPANLGCGRRVASGIERALSRYGRAIIVEDDCLPAASFFPYCAELLERYQDEPRVTSITGTYFLGRTSGPYDIGFSHFPCIWGWATWARAWEGYDRELRGWSPDFFDEIAREGSIPSFLPDAWRKCFEWISTHAESTWDIQFWFLQFKKRGLCAFPYRNQVQNIGAGQGATHTTTRRFSFRKLHPFEAAPLRLPPDLSPDLRYERYLQQEFYSNTTTWRNVGWKVLFKCSQWRRRLAGSLARWLARGKTAASNEMSPDN